MSQQIDRSEQLNLEFAQFLLDFAMVGCQAPETMAVEEVVRVLTEARTNLPTTRKTILGRLFGRLRDRLEKMTPQEPIADGVSQIEELPDRKRPGRTG